MVTAPPSRTNQTLNWGGTLLILAGLLRIPSFRASLPFLPFLSVSYSLPDYYLPLAASGAAILTACVILALGVHGGGGLAGKNAWARISLIGFGFSEAHVNLSNMFGNLGWDFWAQLGIVSALLMPVFAIASVIVITRERTVPKPWRMLPAIVLALFIALIFVNQVFASAPALLEVTSFYQIMSWVLLGVSAMLLSRRTPTFT